MHHLIRTIRAAGLTLAMTTVAMAAQAASLEGAAQASGATQLSSIEISGAGRWFQFGQAPAPGQPWPQFDVSRYVSSIHFDSASARVQITRLQTIDPDRARPAPVEQKVDQYVSGKLAWNLGVGTANATPTPQPAAVEERQAEIWSTPQGFIKAALANQATSKPLKDGVEVSFTVAGKYRYVGYINTQDQVERVRTWIDNPVLGDTLVETSFDAYTNYNGVSFPAHIVRTQGGFRVLDIAVSDVKANTAWAQTVPDSIAQGALPPVSVAVNKLADGVYYLTGGTHHSVAIEQRDHIVLIEAPLNEARSLAVIDKIKETIPGKPIKYLINTHAHFDHSGGLRTLVAQGATIVTHQGNMAYYKEVWANAHKLSPDLLAQKPRAPHFEAFNTKHVLSDGHRKIEVYPIQGNTHNDAFALVYLPAEKILVEVDAYTPLAPNAQPPASPNPYAVNLEDNIDRLKLDVNQIAALHGPGVVKLSDLRSYNGRSKVAAN